MSKAKAYIGVDDRNLYLTPEEFFTGREIAVDSADTTGNAVGVLDQTGRVRRVVGE